MISTRYGSSLCWAAILFDGIAGITLSSASFSTIVSLTVSLSNFSLTALAVKGKVGFGSNESTMSGLADACFVLDLVMTKTGMPASILSNGSNLP